MSSLLFFDIDGTLITLDKRHAMPESAKKALLKARENGHKIIINTGRVKTAIDKHLLEFGFDGLVCGCGTYIEYEGRELFHQSLSKDKCVDYAAKLHDLGYETLFEGNDRLFIDGEYGPGTFMSFIYDYFSKNSDYPIDNISSPDFIFDKFTTSSKEGSDITGFNEYFGDVFDLIPHGPVVVEAVPKGFSKATGIKLLMDRLNVSLEDCYAFGDSVNDLEMLRFVKHSVAMGNSVEDILDKVEYQTTDIEDNGISNALMYYGLI